MDRLVELARLLGQRLHEILRQHLRKAGDVEDVLLGIQRGELAAELRQRVDDLRRRSSHAGVERSEDARRAAADDRDVGEFVKHAEK